jgi:hypothetical protein
MAADQRCALISFAWNLGEDFYGSDGFNTISARLRDHDWAEVPAALELYCDPGRSVSAGLLRRRQAEGELWRQGMASLEVTTATAAIGPASTGLRGVSVAATSTTSAAGTASSSARVAISTSAVHPNPLNVPWFDQLAMNDYNSLRQCYGDSTSAVAELAALRHLGLQAEFRTDGTLQTLRDEIAAGRPVAVG